MNKYWIASLIIINFIYGTIYTIGQQILRQSANDPQIQIARDTSIAMAQGELATTPTTTKPLDIATTLAPFTIIYDENGQPIDGSGYLNGKLPTLPTGIFDYVKNKGEDHLTWQPQPKLRYALIVTRYTRASDQGYIAVGRSLQQVEIREDNLLLLTGVAWIITLVLASIPYLLPKKYKLFS